MKEILIIYPHQLFKKHPGLNKKRPVVLVEESLFFKAISELLESLSEFSK